VVALWAAPAAASSRISVISVRHSSTAQGLIYRLQVGSAAGTTVILVPGNAREASLVVNGVVRERIGLGIPIGSAPLGHAGPTLTLASERPTDRVEVRVEGSTAKILFVDRSVVDVTHGIGVASGAYYAILITLALMQLVALVTLRDPTIAWYLGVTLSLLGIEFSRDRLLPRGTNEIGHAVFRSAFLLSILGFSASFLRLRTRTPRLFVAALILAIVPTAAVPIMTFALHRQVSIALLSALDLVVMLSMVALAAIRRRSGYVPATYLGVGLLGLVVVFASQIVLTLAGIHSPLLNHWGLEVGSTFDVVAFSLAIVLQSRYFASDHERVRNDLNAATYAARHDQLTGLLNRRGLEASLERIASSASTVLYVDLDGFKAINDAGGHAAGDQALQGVADELRRALRNVDVVARVGGDEFVIVLVGTVDAERVAKVKARIKAGVRALEPLGAARAERLDVSVGIAEVAAGTPFTDALARADADAYRVKTEHYARTTLGRSASTSSSNPNE
jgi:diguanylate cyclase (GGDEF)-like protein